MAAIVDLRVGDVLLIEVEVGMTTTTGAVTAGPAECLHDAFLAVRLASALGIVVVAAAGNGNKALKDLAPLSGSVQPFGPAAPFSGAIMVGAGVRPVTTLASGPTHKRWISPLPNRGSNYGPRVDCYGLGENVATLGYGDVGSDGNPFPSPPGKPYDATLWYTKSFNATSAAAAIIAGAALLTQAAYKSGGGGLVLYRPRCGRSCVGMALPATIPSTRT